MERRAARRQPVLVHCGKNSDVANARIRTCIGRIGQLADAPDHVFAGKRYWRRWLVELAGRGKLLLAVLRSSHRGLERYALQVTPAATTQGHQRENQEEPDGTQTKSAHAAPPERTSMPVG